MGIRRRIISHTWRTVAVAALLQGCAMCPSRPSAGCREEINHCLAQCPTTSPAARPSTGRGTYDAHDVRSECERECQQRCSGAMPWQPPAPGQPAKSYNEPPASKSAGPGDAAPATPSHRARTPGDP